MCGNSAPSLKLISSGLVVGIQKSPSSASSNFGLLVGVLEALERFARAEPRGGLRTFGSIVRSFARPRRIVFFLTAMSLSRLALVEDRPGVRGSRARRMQRQLGLGVERQPLDQVVDLP